jgi:hypothetical protein
LSLRKNTIDFLFQVLPNNVPLDRCLISTKQKNG